MSSAYIQPVARVRSLEARLLRQQDWERLLQAHSFQEALNELKGKVYGVSLDRVTNSEEALVLLEKEERYLFSFCARIIPDEKLRQLLLLYPQLTELKKKIREMVNNPSGQVPSFKPALYELFFKKCWQEVKKVYTQPADNFIIDIIIDRLFVEEIFIVVNSLRSEWFANVFKMLVDFGNLRMWLRLKSAASKSSSLSYFLPHGEIDGSVLLKALERDTEDFFASLRIKRYGAELMAVWQEIKKSGEHRLLDNFFINKMRQAAKETIRIYDGPEPILAYLVMRKMELEKMRAVLSGVFYHFPKGTMAQFIEVGHV